jgi:serine/threonine protein phosphatase PrpC
MNINLENQKSLSKLLDDENEIIKYGQSIIESNKNQSKISIIKEFNLNGQDKNISLFGIFDGHNGPEVSKYLSLHFSQFLSENINFTNGNYKKSLEEIFINIDDSLRALQVQLELSNYSIKKDIKKDSNNNEFDAFLELFEPRNLDKVNIAEFCGSSGIVILITEKTAFIANLGNSKCIPINNKNEIIKEKINKEHTIFNEDEIWVLNEKFGNINIDDKNKDKVRDKYINNFPIITTRGFGDLQYKYNNIINFEGQYISNKPDIIEIPLDELNFLIIGNNGCFNEKENTISLEKYFLDNYIKNKEQKLSNIIEEFFKELEKNKEMNINLASIIIEFKHENNLNNLNNILLEEDKKETPDKNDNIKNKSDEEEENL